MWFHCIPSMYLHSLQSFNILITVYIYKKKKYMNVKFEEIRGTKIINLYNEN